MIQVVKQRWVTDPKTKRARLEDVAVVSEAPTTTEARALLGAAQRQDADAAAHVYILRSVQADGAK